MERISLTARWIKELFQIEKKPVKGLMAFEWVVVGYTLLTLLFIFFAKTKLPNADVLVAGRIRIMAMLAALWMVYRLAPCRFTRFARIAVEMALLSWWYPDTYELNRILPNFDHIFAQADQNWFGCQPALLFSQQLPQAWFSEIMDLGYASYFPMILLVTLAWFFLRPEQMERMAFVLIGSFFAYYVIFVFLPVVGPQYYYLAIGAENVGNGVFPNVADYFNHHSERMVSPGWPDGLFYNIVEGLHQSGERPTAAFPSSHVGITVVILLLAWKLQTARQWLFWLFFPFAIAMFFATVYIQAHYVVDVIAGLISGLLLYYVLNFMSSFTSP